uniref:hypothetical protein n=1 Tax=Ferrovibrio sp. TaxID=1917215 RepID=UPI00311EDE03
VSAAAEAAPAAATAAAPVTAPATAQATAPATAPAAGEVEDRRRQMAREMAEQRAASELAVRQMMAEQLGQQQADKQVQQDMAMATNAATPLKNDPAALMAALAQGPQPGARSIAGGTGNPQTGNPQTGNPQAMVAPAAPYTANGRTWFPAFPQGAPVAQRAVGTQPVTQQNVTSKFGAARPTLAGSLPAAAGAAPDGSTAAGDWADRAAAAYQKYFDMQQQTDRLRGQ